MTPGQTNSRYLELATGTATTMVDALAAATTRRLGTAQALVAIWMRPYIAMDPAAVSMENFDRASESATVVAREAREAIDATQRFGEAMAQRALEVQDAYLDTLRGVFDIGVSNLNFVTQATSAQLDDATKRFAEFRLTATERASVN